MKGMGTVHSWAAIVILAASTGVGAAGAAVDPAGTLPPVEKIERPYTNEKCLEKCHGEPGFGAVGARGTLQNLFVDYPNYLMSTHARKGLECVDCHAETDPNFHPRTGYPKVDCRACHSETPPEDAYPPQALKRLADKGIQPPPKESRKAETWMKTRHGGAWLGGDPAAPFCPQCHTAHYVRKSSDPESTVFRSNLSATCGSCHSGMVAVRSVGGALARFRIGAHGKGDLSQRYDVSECVACHQGEAAHGETTVTGQRCPTCHQVLAEERETGAATLHIQPEDGDPLSAVLKWVYEAGFWAAAAAGGLVLLVLGFASLYRKSDG